MPLPPVLILRHVRDEPIGQTAEALQAAGLSTVLWDLTTAEPHVFYPLDWSGLVVIGGPMSVDQVEQYPFLAHEVHWLRDALRAKLPVLGLCLGAQLLAKALDAKVKRQPVPEVGWHAIKLTAAGEQDPLLSDIPSPAMVLAWHADTFELPAGGVLLASNALCRHQAFRFGTSAWGLQFHAEIGAEQLQRWTREPADAADRCAPCGERARAIMEALPRELPGAQILGRKILGRFGKLCRETAQARVKNGAA